MTTEQDFQRLLQRQKHARWTLEMLPFQPYHCGSFPEYKNMVIFFKHPSLKKYTWEEIESYWDKIIEPIRKRCAVKFDQMFNEIKEGLPS